MPIDIPRTTNVNVSPLGMNGARVNNVLLSKRPAKPMADAAPALSIPERVLLFCVASDTDWEHAGITGTTVTAMIVRGLIQRDPAGRLWLTKEGRAVLAALLAKGG
jgi:hypothetical protein